MELGRGKEEGEGGGGGASYVRFPFLVFAFLVKSDRNDSWKCVYVRKLLHSTKQ